MNTSIMNTRFFTFLCFVCLIWSSCKRDTNLPQNFPTTTWKQIVSLPAEKITVLEVANNVVYAAAATKIYQSNDNGTSWVASSTLGGGTQITSLAIFNNKIFAGTYNNGIYMSADNGKTWTNAGQTISPVSSFTIWNNNLYSASAGSAGIFVLNTNNNTWTNFTRNGLPTNYSLDVEKLVQTNQGLLSVQGVNGTFYTYSQNLTQWKENFYYSSLKPGLLVKDMINDQNKLIAATDQQIMSSINDGTTWILDTAGLKKNISPAVTQKPIVLYSGTLRDYVLNNIPTGGTWIQQRDKLASPGATWKNDIEFLDLPTTTVPAYSYAMAELNGILYLGTDNGIYFKKLN